MLRPTRPPDPCGPPIHRHTGSPRHGRAAGAGAGAYSGLISDDPEAPLHCSNSPTTAAGLVGYGPRLLKPAAAGGVWDEIDRLAKPVMLYREISIDRLTSQPNPPFLQASTVGRAHMETTAASSGGGRRRRSGRPATTAATAAPAPTPTPTAPVPIPPMTNNAATVVERGGSGGGGGCHDEGGGDALPPAPAAAASVWARVADFAAVGPKERAGWHLRRLLLPSQGPPSAPPPPEGDEVVQVLHTVAAAAGSEPVAAAASSVLAPSTQVGGGFRRHVHEPSKAHA